MHYRSIVSMHLPTQVNLESCDHCYLQLPAGIHTRCSLSMSCSLVRSVIDLFDNVAAFAAMGEGKECSLVYNKNEVLVTHSNNT